MNLKYQLVLGARELRKGAEDVIGRYAPSPSGAQHLGNIQTALLAWLQARMAGGKFILRMDDLDAPRIKLGSAEQIIDDLKWIGLDWDNVVGARYTADEQRVYAQSNNLAVYQKVFETLVEQGQVFPCVCSRKQIKHKVGRPNTAGHYIYPGSCRKLDAREYLHKKGIAWRFSVSAEPILFTDRIMGTQNQNLALEWGDFIIKRKDGIFAYQFASVVDDVYLKVTDVVRGEDLLSSTPAQIAIYNALNQLPPRFWHMPLKRDDAGLKLSKRDGADSLQLLRADAKTPEQVLGRLAYDLGLMTDDRPLELNELLSELTQSEVQT
ncbi:MAG: tRNA glutamyl-Q(34) synthetase GluQRS [Arenicellales bacterium]